VRRKRGVGAWGRNLRDQDQETNTSRIPDAKISPEMDAFVHAAGTHSQWQFGFLGRETEGD
jgi:hypothetical protein